MTSDESIFNGDHTTLTPDNLTDLIKYARALSIAILTFRVLETRAGRIERMMILILRRWYRDRLRTLLPTLPPDSA